MSSAGLGAYRHARRESIAAYVRTGTQRDAVLHACGANAEHGLRRSNEDKRKAVLVLLADAEWSKWSDNAIARVCKVHHTTVATQRAAHLANSQDSPPSGDRMRTVERGGTTYEQDTTNIGKAKSKPEAQAPRDEPPRQPAEPDTSEEDADEDLVTLLERSYAENDDQERPRDCATVRGLPGT